MIAVVQRVSRASVLIRDGDDAGRRDEIGVGVAALVCAMRGDAEPEADWIADKIASLRIFQDNQGKMNLSAHDVGGAALVVSQFTLAGELRKGTRPSFTRAAPPEIAAPLVRRVADRLRIEHGLRVGEGAFGASMEVELVNDGPVTIVLERSAATDR